MAYHEQCCLLNFSCISNFYIPYTNNNASPRRPVWTLIIAENPTDSNCCAQAGLASANVTCGDGNRHLTLPQGTGRWGFLNECDHWPELSRQRKTETDAAAYGTVSMAANLGS